MDSIKSKNINNHIVEPVKIKKIDRKNIVGGELFDLYCNVYICARKKSGKTSTINKIIEETCDKNTHIIGFVSTHEKDPTWIEIKKNLEKKHIPYTFFKSTIDEGENILGNLVQLLKNEVSELEESKKKKEEDLTPKIINFGVEENEIKIKIKKPSKISSKYLIIFDDVSNELKYNKDLAYLLKTNRHFLSKIIISSQYIHDLPIDCRSQLDNWLIFRGQPEEKLDTIYKYADLSIDNDNFKNLYYYATQEPYHFLNIDREEDCFKECFNKELNI